MSRLNNDSASESSTSPNESNGVVESLLPETGDVKHDPYRAWRFRNFRLLFVGMFVAAIGEQMLQVALGWDLYERTHSALVLGGVGLFLFVPAVFFTLPAGHIADRYNRKRIVLVTLAVLALGSLVLTWLSYVQGSIWLIYGCLLVMGTAEAFNNPASSTMLPLLVPDDVFENAATWSSSSWQLASMLGPGLGGLLIALTGNGTAIYALNVVTALVFVVLMACIHIQRKQIQAGEQTTWRSVIEGLSFLRRTQVMLAAITLDLFAVLLGGATTLLPIFASSILHVGPVGLGWLRAAPSFGAIVVALFLAHRPPFQKAGRTLLLAVAGFGIATIAFGFSRNIWLSFVMLLLLGGLDNISVVIRNTLALTRTPDEMRGRVAAVNGLFVNASNQLGGFESGVTAQFFGPVLSVVGGGIGTILVVLFVSLIWPEMRRLGTLRTPDAE
ncbi:MAG TPA: MFS transporter [Dictyobacter sp.]|nr:MFS transporter [Dictyobacter sp.]